MFKIKIIKETTYNSMERGLERLKSANHELLEQIEMMRQAEDGESVCGQYCAYCKYGIEVFSSNFFGGRTFQCGLTIPCKKFKKFKEIEEDN